MAFVIKLPHSTLVICRIVTMRYQLVRYLTLFCVTGSRTMRTCAYNTWYTVPAGQCPFEGSDRAIVRASAQYVAYRSIGVTTGHRSGSTLQDHRLISDLAGKNSFFCHQLTKDFDFIRNGSRFLSSSIDINRNNKISLFTYKNS